MNRAPQLDLDVRSQRFFRRRSFVRTTCFMVGIGCMLFFAGKQALLTGLSQTTNQPIDVIVPTMQTRNNTTTEYENHTKALLRFSMPVDTKVRNNQTKDDISTANIITDKTTTESTEQFQNPIKDKGSSKNAITIAYAVSVVSCGTRWDASLDHITEGGAVLKHSIHRASVRGMLGGQYDYKMYAIYHPNASACASLLGNMGYELVQRDSPVRVEDIRGDELREEIRNEGCCGEKEFIKLEAYRLTSHPIVVHLDLDTLVLKPMDAIFDFMLTTLADNKTYPRKSTLFANVPFMWPNRPIPAKTNFVFTRDYNMIAPLDKAEHRRYPSIQGGFLVLRPDLKVYRQLMDVILEGDFDRPSGWGGRMGRFYGYTTIQGLLPYFYDVLYPGQSVELNRCVYNAMNDDPFFDKGDVNGTCKTGEKVCEDCRDRPLEDVVTAHFTACGKPWYCPNREGLGSDYRLCKSLDREWYRIRSELEQSWGRKGWGTGNWSRDYFYGFCHSEGKEGLQRINETRR